MVWVAGGAPSAAAGHFFSASRSELITLLESVRTTIAPDGMVWVSWPAKASKLPSEIN